MERKNPVIELHLRMAQTCAERAVEATDPAVRVWWMSAAQKWHNRAQKAESRSSEAEGLVA